MIKARIAARFLAFGSIATLLFAVPFSASRALAATSVTTQASSCSSAPAPASQVGYCTKTFATDSFSSSTIDMKSTNKPTATSGYQWRPFNCFGVTPSTKNVAI